MKHVSGFYFGKCCSCKWRIRVWMQWIPNDKQAAGGWWHEKDVQIHLMP